MPELRSIADLAPAPYNPRTISPANAAALSYSLAEFGDISGIVWNRATGVLVCGHQRLNALKTLYGDRLLLHRNPELGEAWLTAPNGERYDVRVVEWTAEKEKAANVAANSHLLAGEFTMDIESLVTAIEEATPDLHDQLRIGELLRDLDLNADVIETGDQTAAPENIPQMELQPFESYDYVVVLARTAQDWAFLCEKLGIRRVDGSVIAGARRKIGLGRAIEARRLIALLQPSEGAS